MFRSRRSKERRFRAAFEAASVAEVQVIPSTGRYSRVNTKMCELTGYSREELTQMTFLDLTHPDDRARDKEIFDRFISGETPEYRSEKRYVRKDGGIVWVMINAALIRDAQGLPMITIGVVQDVTERRRIETDLRESEKRKAAILSGAMDAIVAINRQGTILEMNPAAEKTFGLSVSQAVGRNVAEVLVPARHREKFIREMGLLFTDRESSLFKERVELIGLRGEKEEFQAEFSVARVETDREVMLIGFARDVSGQREAEEENRRARQLLDMHVQQTPLGVIQWDLGFRVKDWNPSAEKIFGYTREEAIGRHATFILSDAVRPFVDKVWKDLLARVSGSRNSNENITRRGDTIFCEWYNTPLVDSEGAVVGVASLIEDITDRKRSEKEREGLLVREREARVAAETLVRARNDFISIVSHELRTPLTPLKIILTTMRRQLDRNGDATVTSMEVFKKLLDKSTYQLDSLIELMDDVLDLSRIGEEPIPLKKELIDWSQFVRGVIDRNRRNLTEAGCTVFLDLEEGLVGNGDPVRLRRALENLLGNAVKFGRGKPIEMSVRRVRTAIHISVQDHGIGIARTDFEKLFDPFERLASIRNYAGLGLGLYVAQQVISAHGGRIEVVSEPGEGARFTVILPDVVEKVASQAS